MTKLLPNEILVRHSLLEWIRAFDRMRADRYAILCPDKSFSRLEDLLKIKTFMPESDRNSILRQTLFLDAYNWMVIHKYSEITSTPVYLHEGATWAEKYPGIHGEKEILTSSDLHWGTGNFWKYNHPDYVPAFQELVSMMTARKPWSRVVRKIYELCNQFNGIVYFNDNSFYTVYGKFCDDHDGTTPVGEWNTFINDYNDRFGCYQFVACRDEKSYVASTWSSRLKIDYNPPFDIPYRLVVAGSVYDSYQFDGMGVVEYPGRYNVIFDSGPIQGNYTSPLIGIDSIYISTNLDNYYIGYNKSNDRAGWYVEGCALIVYPAEGVFPDYF